MIYVKNKFEKFNKIKYHIDMEDIKIGKIYKHYKGNLYRVIGIGKHSETTEDMVIYQSIKNNQIWIRPINMWNNVIDEKGTLRFTLIDEEKV